MDQRTSSAIIILVGPRTHTDIQDPGSRKEIVLETYPMTQTTQNKGLGVLRKIVHYEALIYIGPKKTQTFRASRFLKNSILGIGVQMG